MYRFLGLSLGIVSIALLGALFGSLSASAASVYDDTIHLTDKLYTGRNDTVEEVTTDFMPLIESYCIANNNEEVYNHLIGIFDTPNSAWAITQSGSETGGYQITIYYTYDKTDNDMHFEPFGSNYRFVIDNPNNDVYWLNLRYTGTVYGCESNLTTGPLYSGNPVLSVSNLPNNPMLFLSNFTFVAPPDYEGVIPPDSYTPPEPYEPERLRPEYEWSIDGNTRQLKLNYLKNISPFLTGSSCVVLDKTGEDFTPVQENIFQNRCYTPAGTLNNDSKYPIPNTPDSEFLYMPEGAGWYILRIDHNQQLDRPPWEYADNESPHIEQVWFQIYWDGKSSINGENIGGCEGDICNNLTGPYANKLTRLINEQSLDTQGLESIIIAPINKLASLPTMVGQCSPITIPIFNGKTYTAPCYRPMYESALPFIGTLYVIINGLVVYALATLTFRLIKNANDPDEDKIEVSKL